MMCMDVDRPDGPTPVPPGQPPDPMMTIVSGRASTWHTGRALCCVWPWAQRRWHRTREWSATRKLHLDDRQQAGVVLLQNRVNVLAT